MYQDDSSPDLAREDRLYATDSVGLSDPRRERPSSAAAFPGVFPSTIFFDTRDEHGGNEVWNYSRVQFFDHVRLGFSKEDGRRRTQAKSAESIPLFGAFELSAQFGRAGIRPRTKIPGA